jgi:SAM-dependent methyltransferase
MTAGCLVCGASAVHATAPGWTRCRRCGFVEGPMSAGGSCAAYRDDHERGHSRRVEDRRHAVYAPLVERVAPWGGRRLLDVGSGAGVLVRLAGAAGWDAVGVDPAGPDLVEHGVRLVRAPFPPPPAGPFELVTFVGSLNYMADPVAALVAARGVLVPGGRVLIRVPNASFHLAVRRLARVIGPDTAPGQWLRRGSIVHARAFTARALECALTRAGFRRVVVEGSAPSPGDPYGTGARGMAAVKTVVRGGALIAETVLRQPGLLSSSLLATAVAEGADC